MCFPAIVFFGQGTGLAIQAVIADVFEVQGQAPRKREFPWRTWAGGFQEVGGKVLVHLAQESTGDPAQCLPNTHILPQ